MSLPGTSKGRKMFGPRTVVCSKCGARGTANLKVIGDKKVVCGDCKRLESK